MLKELLPEEETAPKVDSPEQQILPRKEPPEQRTVPKKEPVRAEPVVELKAVAPKPKPPVTEKGSPEPSKKQGATISDKHLLMLIQKYKEADRICEIAHMTLQTLQRRVGYLSYRLKRYIHVEGLYRDTAPVKLTRDGIKIPKGHFVESDFKIGDLFNIGFKDNYVILARLQK
jgi:hypothetical protein